MAMPPLGVGSPGLDEPDGAGGGYDGGGGELGDPVAAGGVGAGEGVPSVPDAIFPPHPRSAHTTTTTGARWIMACPTQGSGQAQFSTRTVLRGKEAKGR